MRRWSWVLALALCAAGLSGCGGAQVEGDEGSASRGGDGAVGELDEEEFEAVAATGGVVLTVRAPAQPWLTSAAFSGDGQQLVFSMADGAVWELDATDGAITARPAVEGGALRVVDGAELLVQTAPIPRVFGLRQGAELLRLPDWKEASQVAVSHNGEHLLIGQGARLGRWNLPRQAVASVSGERVEEFVNRQMAESMITLPEPPSALDVGDSSRFMVAVDGAGKQGTLRVWDPKEPGTLKTVGRTNGTVRHLSMSPDEKRAVAINQDGTVFVVPTDKQAFERWALGKSAHHAEWTDDGMLILQETEGVTRAYDAASGAVQWEVKPPQPFIGCWSTRTRLACSDGTSLALMRADSGKILGWAAALEGQTVLVLPDGSHVGAVPAGWVSRADGSTFDDDEWRAMQAPARVLRVLQSW